MSRFVLKWLPDPLSQHPEATVFDGTLSCQHRNHRNLLLSTPSLSQLVTAQCPLEDPFLFSPDILTHFHQAGHKARIALADLFARGMADTPPLFTQVEFVRNNDKNDNDDGCGSFSCSCHIASLDFIHPTSSSSSTRKAVPLPYILERTDVWCTHTHLCVQLRITFSSFSHSCNTYDYYHQALVTRDLDILETFIHPSIFQYLTFILTGIQPKILPHVAHTLLQSYIRTTVLPHWDFTSTKVMAPPPESSSLESGAAAQVVLGAVAFLANGSILPRKSGMSVLPMLKHQAVPLVAPKDSTLLYRELYINLGFWNSYIQDDKVQSHHTRENEETILLVIPGLIIPNGVTLICGGGFHGKSTLLKTISYGIYDKIQGDGRELCITVHDALFVRAEDGRYVSNCNITAFMSSTSFFMNGKLQSTATTQPDGHSPHPMAYPTNHLFSTQEASGSTSQASNVMEAIEFGATALLMDEDVSAANFMARDGRMRALVKDETITPFLYRVNGLYRTRHISSVIVIGGIGDWLDVPDNVILMDKQYQVNDALERARSISHQFSYNHIQYGGRGVVHRLEWRKYEDGKNDNKLDGDNPISLLVMDDINPRDRFIHNAQRFAGGILTLFQGGDSKFTISPDADGTQQLSAGKDEYEDDCGSVDLSKCEQVAGRIWQVVGCALALKWMIRNSAISPNKSIKDLIEMFDSAMDDDPGGSFSGLLETLTYDELKVLNTTGYALRPRKYEIASAVARLRGGVLLPVPFTTTEMGELIRRKNDTDLKAKALADIWAQRR